MADNQKEQKEVGVTFDKVEKVINDMLLNGIKPTQRAVRDVTGGRTEKVTELFNAVFKKRDLEIAKIADEIGSSDVGKLIAATLTDMVNKKNLSLQNQLEQKQSQLDELNELMQEKEDECQSSIQLIQIKSDDEVSQSAAERDKAIERADRAEVERAEVLEQAQTRVVDANRASEDAIKQSEALIKAEQQKAETLVESAKKEAAALVQASDKRLDTAERELAQLREQVKQYTVAEAKHLLEKEQFEQTKVALGKYQDQLSESKTDAVRLKTENINFEKDTKRLIDELKHSKKQFEKAGEAQVLLIEAQKTISQLQHDINSSEKQRESLSQALASSGDNRK